MRASLCLCLRVCVLHIESSIVRCRRPLITLHQAINRPTSTLHSLTKTGPGVCAKSNDVENPITACKQAKTEDGRTVYYKVW